MRTTFFRFLYLLTISALVLSACNLPGNNVAADTPSPQPSATKATATRELTATPTEVLPTETPSETATETLLPEPSATATPDIPMATVGRESNCRTGPAGNYDLVATYQAGQVLEVVANDLGAGYLFVRNPEKPEEQCYLLANSLTIDGDLVALPKFTPRASPTAAPYFTASFKKFDTCEGYDYALFVVENTGSIAFRSVYIKVTDQKAGKSVEQVLSAFDLRVKCVLAKNIAPLDPGMTGYVTSPPFKWNARANKLQAILMLCTEKALKGTCVPQSLEVKP
ncbi:MAG TPA: hypothetical protein VFR47_27250 [Anaerolineales bacterium]|nr:hypothetical protein [Anaerolineales bacterium]